MSASRVRPHTGGRFLVAIGDADPWSDAAGFCEVVFPVFDIVPPDQGRESAAPPRLTLRRGTTGGLDLYHWWDAVRRRKDERRTVTVQLLAAEHDTVVCIWRFVNARPVSLAYSPLSAIAPAIVMETIELEFDRVEMAESPTSQAPASRGLTPL